MNRKRKINESYTLYRASQRREAQQLKHYLRGRMVHESAPLQLVKAADGTSQYVFLRGNGTTYNVGNNKKRKRINAAKLQRKKERSASLIAVSNTLDLHLQRVDQ